MTAPKDIRGCNPYWLELFDLLERSPETVVKVPCENLKRAQADRLDFYRARRLVLQDEGARMLYPQIRMLECKVNDDPPYVEFRHKAMAPLGLRLKEALERATKGEVHD